MAFEFSNQVKQCALCSAWLGARQITRNGYGVTVEKCDIKAGCGIQAKSMRPTPTANTPGCAHWSKWQAVK